MSSCLGTLIDFNGNVLFFKYSNTADACSHILFKTAQEAINSINERKYIDRKCRCRESDNNYPCMLFEIEYSFLFHSNYCGKCLVITGRKSMNEWDFNI